MPNKLKLASGISIPLASDELCLACGQRHKNPVRGGKVSFLRHCFKKGRPARRQHLPPQGNYRNVATPPAVSLRERTAASSRLQKALKGWGAT